MEEQEVENIVNQEISRRRKSFLKKASIPIMIVLLIGIPALADVNIRDAGDLILHGDTGLDIDNSTIENVSDPVNPKDAANKNWTQEYITKQASLDTEGLRIENGTGTGTIQLQGDYKMIFPSIGVRFTGGGSTDNHGATVTNVNPQDNTITINKNTGHESQTIKWWILGIKNQTK